MSLAAAACSTKTSTSGSSGGNNAGPPKPGGTLNVGLTAETDGWNPTGSQWAADAYQVAETIFDPLVTYGADQKPHPFLAQSVTSNSDNTVWTITLRPGIKFQDGEPLNAAAVKLQLDKDVASALVGQAFRFVKSVNVINDLTVQVMMTQPWVAFPAALSAQGGYVAAPAQLNATGTAQTDHPIGTGPYVFKQWVRDDHLTVTKNPNYWQKNVAFPDTITFKVIPDDQTRLASMQSGQIDMMNTGVGNVVLQARADHSINRVEFDTDPVTMIMLNMAVKPFDDVRVRQALMYATNQNELRTRIGRGLGQVATEPYLPGSPWYVGSGYPTSPDLQKAKQLVDQYKAANHISGDLKFTLGCTPTPNNTAAMKLIKSEWSQVGIDANLNFTEQATYINNAITGDYQANCWAQLGAIDPDADSVWWVSQNAHPPGQLAINFMRMKDPRVDQSLDTARRTNDQTTRKNDYGQVWKYLAQNLPYVYLGHPHVAVLWSNRVHGVGTSTLPDGSKPLLYKGEAPQVVPLDNVWVTS
jgi:ABC-type transport system substrate-binding protein